MLSWIRTKFGPVIVGGIIGVIALVFVFYGVFNPKTTQGIRAGAVAGSVNGDSISIADFNREFARRLEFFKQMAGGKLSDEQLKQFRVREGVFQELVSRRLMVQESSRAGMDPSDEEIRAKIREIPAFQKDGKFDTYTYKQVLQANNHTPASFENLIREDLAVQQWTKYFKDRVHVSDEEIKDEFMISRDKRNVKYVLITTEAGKKGVKVESAEVEKYLKDTGKANIAKAHYEGLKEKEYKGKTFDQVKTEIARDLLASEKLDQIKKINDGLAVQVEGLLTASAGSDAKVNALLKPYGVTVKTTGLFSRESPYLPGIGEARDLTADAFAKKSPIDPAQGGKAKKYNSAAWTMVAIVSESQKPDLAKLDAEREKIVDQMIQRKQRGLEEEWMKKLNAKAKIEMNKAVVEGSGGGPSDDS